MAAANAGPPPADDWDSLPLEPDSSWDAIPPPSPPGRVADDPPAPSSVAREKSAGPGESILPPDDNFPSGGDNLAAHENSVAADDRPSPIEDSFQADDGPSPVEDSLLADDVPSPIEDEGPSPIADDVPSPIEDEGPSPIEDFFLADDRPSPAADSLLDDDRPSPIEDSFLADDGPSPAPDSLLADDMPSAGVPAETDKEDPFLAVGVPDDVAGGEEPLEITGVELAGGHEGPGDVLDGGSDDAFDLELDEQAIRHTLPERRVGSPPVGKVPPVSGDSGGAGASAEDSWDAEASGKAASAADVAASAEDSWDAAASGKNATAADAGAPAEDSWDAEASGGQQTDFVGEKDASPEADATAGATHAGAAPSEVAAESASAQTASEGTTALPQMAVKEPTETSEGTGPTGDAGDMRPEPPQESGVDRTRFLESLMEGGETVPQKVELDLDGIFDQARKEADELSPDSTRTPVTAPLPQDPVDPDMPAPPPEPLKEPAVKKVSKFKLLFLVVPVALGALGLLFGIYQIFFKSSPAPPPPPLVLSPESLVDTSEPVPGEMTLGRFTLTLDPAEGGDPAVAELEIILHYHDTADASVINANMIRLRDVIFRVTKNRGAGILRDPVQRRQLQADLLETLNSLQPFRTGQEHQLLTYVQISLLKRV